MKNLKLNPAKFVVAMIVLWVIALSIFISPSMNDGNGILFAVLPTVLVTALILTSVSVVVLLFGLQKGNPKNENFAHNSLAKVLGYSILSVILVGTFAATKSLGYSSLSNDLGGRFVYENIAAAFGFAGIMLTLVLSVLQKDIYWVTGKTTELDERQVQDRRSVFETSYKIGLFTVLIVLWWFSANIDNLPAIIANNHSSLPGHLYWLPVNLVTALVALPLVVATKKSRKL